MGPLRPERLLFFQLEIGTEMLGDVTLFQKINNTFILENTPWTDFALQLWGN